MEIRKLWAGAQQSLHGFMSYMSTKKRQLQLKYKKKMWVKTRQVKISGNRYEFVGQLFPQKLYIQGLTFNK